MREGKSLASRLPYYRDAKVVLMCFDVASQPSFESVRDKWANEVKQNTEAPLIIVGLKAHVRRDSGILHDGLVDVNEGLALAERLGARKYLECSTVDLEGLDLVFDEVSVFLAHDNTMTDGARRRFPLRLDGPMKRKATSSCKTVVY